MEAPRPSSFAGLVEWLSNNMTVYGTASLILAVASVPLGFGDSVLLFVAGVAMFLVAQLFIWRWLYGPGLRSASELGFESNRQALWYDMSTSGMRRPLTLLATASFFVALGLGFASMNEKIGNASAALVLAASTFAAASQAARCTRVWPADTKP